MTLLLLWGSAFVSIIYPKIYSAFGIIGGVNGTMIGVSFPGLIYYKLSPRKMTDPIKIVTLLTSLCLTGVGFTAAIVSAFGLGS